MNKNPSAPWFGHPDILVLCGALVLLPETWNRLLLVLRPHQQVPLFTKGKEMRPASVGQGVETQAGSHWLLSG
jgi:hypothetical protein